MEVSLSARWRLTPLDRQRSCPRQPHKGEHNQIAPLSFLAQSQTSCLTLDPQNYSLPRSSPEWVPCSWTHRTRAHHGHPRMVSCSWFQAACAFMCLVWGRKSYWLVSSWLCCARIIKKKGQGSKPMRSWIEEERHKPCIPHHHHLLSDKVFFGRQEGWWMGKGQVVGWFAPGEWLGRRQYCEPLTLCGLATKCEDPLSGELKCQSAHSIICCLSSPKCLCMHMSLGCLFSARKGRSVCQLICILWFQTKPY